MGCGLPKDVADYTPKFKPFKSRTERPNPFSKSSLGANKQLTRRELIGFRSRATFGARFRTIFSPREDCRGNNRGR